MTLRISGLPGNMTNDLLLQFLEPFGVVYSAHIVFDPINNKSKRFGFVRMARSEDAKRLIASLDGKTLSTGQILKVVEHKTRENLTMA